MERFRSRLFTPKGALALLALDALIVVAGCTSAAPPAPADVVVAPVPKIYTCTQETALDILFPSLPPIVQQVIGDFHAERVTLNRLQGKSGPPACAK